MNPLITTLQGSKKVAEGTMAFFLEKPAGFSFRPGQAIDVTLIDPPETDAAGNTRAFSIVSAPGESSLEIATRMRDTAFKRSLRAAPPGTKLQIDGPMGSLTLHKNAEKPAVFLAGGIGITPFMSMIRHAAAEHLPHRLYLFYSNRRPEDAAFLAELQRAQQGNGNFLFVPTMTQAEKSAIAWTGATGYITAKMLGERLLALRGPIYYIAGPPAMVANLREMLVASGIDEDDIRTEEFGGY